jgi:hypothetical protein
MLKVPREQRLRLIGGLGQFSGRELPRRTAASEFTVTDIAGLVSILVNNDVVFILPRAMVATAQGDRLMQDVRF